MKNNMAKLKYQNDYLQVIMPDGQVIPEQVDIKIENEVGQRKIATAIVTMLVDISEIGDRDSVYSDKIKNIQSLELENITLKEERDSLAKHSDYWETRYNTRQKIELSNFKKLTYLLLALFLATAIKLYTLL